MEVRKGYKQTEVGVIPEDWEVTTLGNVSQIIGRIGFRGYTKADIVEKGYGAIAISPSNIDWDNGIDFTECTYISWSKYEESPEIKIANGDIVLVKTGSTFGKTAIVRGLKECATLNPQVAVLKNVLIDRFFLSYMMGFDTIQDQIAMAIVGGAVPTLSQALSSQFKLPIPPTITEQHAIAEALSDTDALIENLTKLIAKKRDIKQGAMQELLTGRKRLEGFDGSNGEFQQTEVGQIPSDWKVKKLGELAEIISGGTPSTNIPEFWDGGINWCTPSDITKNDKKYISTTGRTISKKGLENSGARLLPAGTILYCSRATIGEMSIAVGEFSTNQGFKSLVCHDTVYNEYLYYRLFLDKNQFLQKGIGSTFLEVSRRDTADVIIPVPSFAEQSAIAKVLSDMDTEIDELQSKLDKYRLIKQGMMHNLLTGTIRLI